MKRILCLLLLTTVTLPAATAEEWMKNGLFHPDLITAVRDELELTTDQQSKLTQQMNAAREQAEALEQAVKEQEKALHKLLQDPGTSAAAADSQLTKLLEAEAALKHLQLGTLIAVRDVLTPEQIKRARKLSPPKMAQTADAETRMMAMAEKFRAAVEALGIQPTEAMKERGSEVEALMKSGDPKAAGAALDRLVEDSGLKELEAEPDEIDFSKYEPGDTDLETLKQRYQDVQARAQSVVSLPLMRELLQAKAAFEAAKASQDAETVGRILSYVEGKLKQD
jgi:Spy/CpxP family protein refolding chaperone